LIKITNGTPTQVYAATTTNSSKVMTGLTQAQTSQLSVGMAVSGTGIAASSTIASVQPGTGVTLNNNMTATATNIAITFAPTVSITAITQAISLPSYKYVAVTANTSTLVAGDITGATEVVLNTSTQATPTFTTRTAAQMIADIPNAQIGMTWKVTVLNRNSGTLTMAAGSGVTITGTATIATVNWKDFICTYTAADTIVMQVGASGAL
jgi:Zn-dependent alcohol dehydrogenase